MTVVSESYRKVPYDLREAKQVERRMIIDALQRLGMAGFPIRDYQYTGMGSIYFYDFILFHKYLGIEQMLSVEISPKIRNRVLFNRPYSSVDVEIGEIGQVLPRLSRDRRHILWLDYDNVIQADYARDLVSALSMLPVSSIVLLTVDAESPGASKDQTPSPDAAKDHFYSQVGEYIRPSLPPTEFAASKLVERNIEVLANVIARGMMSRKGSKFLPFFNFVYRDGHRMLTIGGMIAAPEDERKVLAAGLGGTCYYRGTFEEKPCELRIPRFTRKERLALDWAMPRNGNWTPSEFETSEEELRDYNEIYKYLPTYAELLL